MRASLAQARNELDLSLRRGESLLLALVIPAGLLGFFSEIRVLPTGPGRPIDFLAPGIIALAIMSTSLVNLAISTGFERSYHILKKLATTPLSRFGLIEAKVLAVIALQLIQVVVLGAEAFALGWHPQSSLVLDLAAAILATAGFAGIGLTLAGSLGEYTTLAAANGLWVVLLLLGGVVFPTAKLPGILADLSQYLPITALGNVLRATGPAGTNWVVLAIWALLGPAMAAKTFRFD